jgi:hypothetical protein
LLGTTHMKNGHTGCHTHTWRKNMQILIMEHSEKPTKIERQKHPSRLAEWLKW